MKIKFEWDKTGPLIIPREIDIKLEPDESRLVHALTSWLETHKGNI